MSTKKRITMIHFYNRGFTLIELLVIMAVLSILISIGANMFIIAQRKARDSQRKADLRTIQTALEAYRTSTGVYPPAVGAWLHSSSSDTWIPGLVPGYLPKVPRDPSANGQGTIDPWVTTATGNRYVYGYTSADGQHYNLIARLEDKSDPDRCEIKQYLWGFNDAIQSWCSEPEGSGGNSQYSKYLYSVGQW